MTAIRKEIIRLLDLAEVDRHSSRGEALFEMLIAHSEEWQDRASAFGAELEPSKVAFMSASAMAGDPTTLERLELSGCGREVAADLLTHLRVVADRLAREGSEGTEGPAPRRRWGEGSPRPSGAAWPWWHDQRHH
jgi:hypothetical protein